ncbi:ComEC/Rec2 family competence protein [Vibrio vulnificus]|uniref:ComEC/Rec2 family competence protein n=1 Tax=Vibrio vulnificus TaxID=672 RepID=UPI00102C86CA|nr:MBL fold metallo-hydrolase [Vibrio vulnificus]RZR49006.1 MBL fold metallo-hydrolase [Vibrio vulnificus]
MAISVRVLKANHGDCILVTHKGSHGTFNLLIDGGNARTFKYGPQERMKGELCKLLDELKAQGQHLDLVILTHIDDDHIGGLLKALKFPSYSHLVKSVWFNSSRLITNHFSCPEIPENDLYLPDSSPDTSVQQGKKFEDLLDELGIERGHIVMAGLKIVKGPFTFNILSPNETQLRKLLCIWPVEQTSPNTSAVMTDYHMSLEQLLTNDRFESDTSIANGSSIAFMLQADDQRMLFLGDAYDTCIVESLKQLGFKEQNKLQLSLVKISHHGSQYNTSSDFLSMISATHYVISTNGARHGLPNKRTIARILAAGDGKICFNYPEVTASMLLPSEQHQYAGRLDVVGQIEFEHDA